METAASRISETNRESKDLGEQELIQRTLPFSQGVQQAQLTEGANEMRPR